VAEQISFEEFKVDLRQLQDAIGAVKREHDTIHDTMASIGSEFALVKDSWDTPSEQSFDAVQAWLRRVTQDLENILQDSIGRMQRAYDNYHQAEEANTKNNTPQGGEGGGGGGGGGKARLAGTGELQPTTVHPAQPAGEMQPTTVHPAQPAGELHPTTVFTDSVPPTSG
jgi:WXG100 family type VII secretion target